MLVLTTTLSKNTHAQSGLCDSITPFYFVDLSANPDTIWVSPAESRNGLCCGNSSPDVCIEFELILNPDVIAINFRIASGAVPGGSMFYQIECGPQVAVGSPICVTAGEPVVLTFCKPGNNQNTYSITTITKPEAGPDQSTSEGCSVNINVSGLIPSTIIWSDVTSGTGAYNSYLSCTGGCASTTVTPQPGFPPYVDYLVCGAPLSGQCSPVPYFCDTIRVYFYPAVQNSITPNPAYYCENNPGVMLNPVINGGVPPLEYIWTFLDSGLVVGNDQDYYAIFPGTYQLEVRDQAYPGCPAKFSSVQVIETPAPQVFAGNDHTFCPSAQFVQLIGSVSGATGGIWSGGSGLFVPSDTSLVVSYQPTPAEMTNSSLQLILTTTGTGACAPVSDTLYIYFTAPLYATYTYNPLVCFGDTTTAYAIPAGGTAPYSYLWSTGGVNNFESDLNAGNYQVTIQDATEISCTLILDLTILQPEPLYVSANANAPFSCQIFNTAVASGSGGVPPYSFLWSNGVSGSSADLDAGLHIVTVTDFLGCQNTDSISVTAASVVLNAYIPAISPLCFGDSAPISAIASGGFGGYTYNWSNGTTTAGNIVTAGTYSVTVTDTLGCTTTAQTTVTELPALEASLTFQPIVCPGLKTPVSIIVSGGLPPYTITWSDGTQETFASYGAGNHSVTIVDSSPWTCSLVLEFSIIEEAPITITLNTDSVKCYLGQTGSIESFVSGGIAPFSYLWSTGNTTSNISGLYVGQYAITVTDSIGCVELSSAEVFQPDLLELSVSTNNVLCNGTNTGSALANASGGVPGYEYIWSNGNNGSSSPTLSAGTYYVTVSDNNLCQTSTVLIVTEPPLLFVDTSVVHQVSCFGGSDGYIVVLPAGGVLSYTYSWSNGSSSPSGIFDLTIGNFTLTITDANGCAITDGFSISQPEPLSIQSNVNHVTCNSINDGSIINSVEGGIPPYSYNWSASDQTDSSATDLYAGYYGVTVTDQNNCDISNLMNVGQPAPLAGVVVTLRNVSCDGGSDGALAFGINGGIQPYTYNWPDVQTIFPYANNLEAGTYSMIVTDANQCEFEISASISSPPPIEVSIETPDSVCSGSTVITHLFASGGVPPYAYHWSLSASQLDYISTQVFSDTSFSGYVIDDHGCISTLASGATNIFPLPDVEIQGGTTACKGETLTFSAETVSGNILSWTWQPGNSHGTTYSIAPENNQTIILTAIDFCGIAAFDTIEITVNPLPEIIISTPDTASCSQICRTFEATGSISSGEISSWEWNFGDGSGSSNQVAEHCFYGSGTFYITLHATSDMGCPGSAPAPASVTIFPNNVNADFYYSPSQPDEFNTEVEFVDISTSANTTNWVFSDTPEDTSGNTSRIMHNFPGVGNYCITLIAADVNGCIDVAKKCLEVIPVATFFVPNAFTPDGDGTNDYFRGIGTLIEEYEMMIFDRWGELIYQTQVYDEPWDGSYQGETVQEGVYVYKIKVKIFNQKEETHCGHVTVIRK
ncbi:MAG: gliding motility-associated C-terminal domain-containing protein [Bacteroidetes bacterium]|nr:gliding motility-associated C-terminal domain-containing protein [Bacteroidota bacterium]